MCDYTKIDKGGWQMYIMIDAIPWAVYTVHVSSMVR